MDISACFPLFWPLAGGLPAPRQSIRIPPFNVREAVFTLFNVDLPPALQPPFCSLFVSFSLPNYSARRAHRILSLVTCHLSLPSPRAPSTIHPPTTGESHPPPPILPRPKNHPRAPAGGIFQPLETFFPIIGKPPKNFSNHWKKSAEFSNHWKTFFQSLENSRFADEPADWPTPGCIISLSKLSLPIHHPPAFHSPTVVKARPSAAPPAASPLPAAVRLWKTWAFPLVFRFPSRAG